MKTLGQHIVERRGETHKTLRQTARETEISPTLLSLIEHGKHKPTTETVVKLAKVLGGDADVWCGLIGKITPSAEQELSRIAYEDPDFFRTMVQRFRKG